MLVDPAFAGPLKRWLRDEKERRERLVLQGTMEQTDYRSNCAVLRFIDTLLMEVTKDEGDENE